MYKVLSSVFFLFIGVQSLFSQEVLTAWKTQIFDENIHTLQVFRPNWELSYPIIELNSSQILEVHFDDFQKVANNYSYTIEFCNADWTISDLMKSDYIQGFDEQPITNYQFSSNTTKTYVHYQLDLPNSDVDFLISGNYILKVYKDYNVDSIVFSQQFFVLDPQFTPQVEIIRPINALKNNTHQQVNISIIDVNNLIRDPYSDLLVKLRQNNRPDREIILNEPKYIRGSSYIYSDEVKNLFSGTSEYLHFDTKSIRFKEMRTDSIVFDGTHYHYYIDQDELMPWRTYASKPDINGRYKVQLQNSNVSHLQADYVYVHLSVDATKHSLGQELFVIGDFNFWQKNKHSKLIWNREANAFSNTFFLKQGYFNYCIENKDVNAAYSPVENHAETENDYLIWVYLKDKTLNFDKLVGFFTINTLRGVQ